MFCSVEHEKKFNNLGALLHPVSREERADCFIICFHYIGNLPPPTSAEEVGARVLAQERLEKKGVSVYCPLSLASLVMFSKKFNP